MSVINPYLKFVVAILGAVITSAGVYYGSAHWFPILTSVVTALTVYLTPNLPKVSATVQPVSPVPSVQKDSNPNPFGD